MEGTDKITRVLMLFYRLIRGEEISKIAFAVEHDVTGRSVDRDIEDIRIFLSEVHTSSELIFDKSKNTYYMNGRHHAEMSGVEIIALLKILIGSRAFRIDEMSGLVSAVSSLIDMDGQRQIKELVRAEMQNYISPTHNKAIMKMQWDLNQCILRQRKIKLSYCKAAGDVIERVVYPMSVVFSEFNFYLIGFIDEKEYDYPAFFRIDSILSFTILEERYPRDLHNEYNVGEMRKSIKFINEGRLIHVKLKIKSAALEIVLNQLSNVSIIERNEGDICVQALTLKDGFIRWVLTQSDNVEVLEPLDIREEINKEAIKILNIYSNREDESYGEKN